MNAVTEDIRNEVYNYLDDVDNTQLMTEVIPIINKFDLSLEEAKGFVLDYLSGK